MKRLLSVLASLLFATTALAAALSSSAPRVRRSAAGSRARSAASLASTIASGVGIQIDVVGRVIGGGNTLFRTAVDFSNNTNTATQVDFYFDAAIGGARVEFVGSITAAGIVAQGTGLFAAHSVFHSEDFVDDMRLAGAAVPGNLTINQENAGVLGSMLLIYDSPQVGLFDQVGQGGATARFYSVGCGGTIGVSAAGHELTSTEPKTLVGVARDTLGVTNSPQLYTNYFITNEGYVSGSGSVCGGSHHGSIDGVFELDRGGHRILRLADPARRWRSCRRRKPL